MTKEERKLLEDLRDAVKVYRRDRQLNWIIDVTALKNAMVQAWVATLDAALDVNASSTFKKIFKKFNKEDGACQENVELLNKVFAKEEKTIEVGGKKVKVTVEGDTITTVEIEENCND